MSVGDLNDLAAVHQLHVPTPAPAIGLAIDAFLDTLDHAETAGTHRVYGGTLAELRTALGAGLPLDALADPAVEHALVGWFEGRWGPRAPATFNRNLDALRAAVAYWVDQGWISADPTRRLTRRGRAPDRSKSIDRAELDRFLRRRSHAIRERTLWRMLYESAARASEVLRLDIGHLDLPNRRTRVRRKGSAVDIIVWQTGTARLLPHLLAGRTTGPLFLTERRARVPLAAGDLAPDGRARLSYRRAAECFEEATAKETDGPWNLQRLRHAALTHAAEEGANTPTLLAFSGHANVASLKRYTRLSPEALGRWQQRRDPHTRG